MIRHIILFKSKPQSSPSQVERAITQFLGLKSKLSGIITMTGSECHFSEAAVKEKAKHFFTHAIYIEFKDENSLHTFFNDPITHPAKNGIVDVTENGYHGIIGFELKSAD